MLKVVIPDAIKHAAAEVALYGTKGHLTPTKVRQSWINCLRDAFEGFYGSRSGSRRIAIFGGTPRDEGCKAAGLRSGIRQWSRWEFLHDIAVVEWETTAAAFARDPMSSSDGLPLPFITRALWQVESELAGDGTKVAEDASKLRVCLAESKLLVASLTIPSRQERWLDFLIRLMAGMDGERFIALVPNYGCSRGYAQWQQQSVPFKLYRCGPNSGDVDLLLCHGEA